MTSTHLETPDEDFYAEEPLIKFWQDGKDLCVEHFAEVGLTDFNFSVFVDKYLEIEKTGAIKCFTVRKLDSVVGYAIFYLSTHGHTCEMCARCDCIYVVPEHRGRLGLKFLKWCDEQLKSLQVKFVLHSVTKKKDYSLLLKRMDYNHIEDIYLKIL